MTAHLSNSEITNIHLEILKLIPSQPYHITTPEICKALNDLGIVRDKRSVERDLKKLREQYSDILFDDRDKPYTYSWKKGSEGLSFLKLSEAQSLLLKLAEQQLAYILPSNLLSQLEPFFKQANQLLREKQSNQPARWLNKVCTPPSRQPLLPANIDEQIFITISEALYHDKQLNITYQNPQGDIWQKNISPLAIFPQFSSVYLVAKIEGYDDYRHLALHRIQSAKMLTLSADRPADFDIKPYRQYGVFQPEKTDTYILRFRIADWAGKHLFETPLSKDQTLLEQGENDYRFQATVEYTELLEWWLNSFGEHLYDVEWQEITP